MWQWGFLDCVVAQVPQGCMWDGRPRHGSQKEEVVLVSCSLTIFKIHSQKGHIFHCPQPWKKENKKSCLLGRLKLAWFQRLEAGK